MNLNPSPLPREEESSDVEEEEKSRDWADQVEEEVKKEATEKLAEEEEDYLKVLEGWRREVVTTREWHEIEPKTVRTVEAFWGLEDEAELYFEPGALITGVRPASWVEVPLQTYHSRWLEGTLEGGVGLVMECFVEYLPSQSDSAAD